MHSFVDRANRVLMVAMVILALMLVMASMCHNLNVPSPTAEIKVQNVNWFEKRPDGNDEVQLMLNISADLQTLFAQNTKQVFVSIVAEYETPENSLNQISLWDVIIQNKEHAKFSTLAINKYRFIDQGNNLRRKEFNLTLHWDAMPQTGKIFVDKIVVTGYRLPDEYI